MKNLALVGLSALVACTAPKIGLTNEDRQATRRAGVTVIEKPDCGAVLERVHDGCAVEQGTRAYGSWLDASFRIRCPETKPVCGTRYDCACLPLVRTATRHGPRPLHIDQGADSFKDVRLVPDEPTTVHADATCNAALFTGANECFVRGAREVGEEAALFEYWLECAENTELCGKPARCDCSTHPDSR